MFPFKNVMNKLGGSTCDAKVKPIAQVMNENLRDLHIM